MFFTPFGSKGLTCTVGKRSQQSNPGSSTNQPPVDNTVTEQNTEQPYYEDILEGHINEAGPSGTEGIKGTVTSPRVNVPTSGRTETETDVASDPAKPYQPLNFM